MQTLQLMYEQLDAVAVKKNQMVKSQIFESAAALRDTEKKLQEEVRALEKTHKLFLSKSKYVRGLNCDKSLWLYVHKYNEQTFSDAQEAVFQQGTDVGTLARQLFPDGVLAVPEGSYPGFSSAAYTQSLIEQGVTTIYEATFVYDNIIVAVDVLDLRNGVWNAFEVKSTTKVKDTHYTDAAIQYYVLSAQLWKIEMYIVFINREYIRMGALELQKLFTATKVSSELKALQENILSQTRKLKLTLLGAEPDTAVGPQCTSPYTCSFYDYCHKDLPYETGDNDAMVTANNYIDQEAIREYVGQVIYPIGFLDFETIMPAVPMFDQSRPYQQMVFQYSLHTQKSAEHSIAHHELLADCTGDPRLQIIPALLEQTLSLETVFVYNVGFERSRINEMAQDFPQYASALNALAYKLLDLMPVFRSWYRTAEMGSRYSIKVVLPALCPDLNYDDLLIGDGIHASMAFLNLYQETDEEKIAAIRAQLITYCTQDTFGMVRLWEVLKKV